MKAALIAFQQANSAFDSVRNGVAYPGYIIPSLHEKEAKQAAKDFGLMYDLSEFVVPTADNQLVL